MLVFAMEYRRQRCRAFVKAHFGTLPNVALADILGVQRGLIRKAAKDLGLIGEPQLEGFRLSYVMDRLGIVDLDIIAISVGMSCRVLKERLRKLRLPTKNPRKMKPYIAGNIERELVMEYYGELTNTELAGVLRIGYKKVLFIIEELRHAGLITPVKPSGDWSTIEIQYLKERYPFATMETLMISLNRHMTDILATASLYKIRRWNGSRRRVLG